MATCSLVLRPGTGFRPHPPPLAPPRPAHFRSPGHAPGHLPTAEEPRGPVQSVRPQIRPRSFAPTLPSPAHPSLGWSRGSWLAFPTRQEELVPPGGSPLRPPWADTSHQAPTSLPRPPDSQQPPITGSRALGLSCYLLVGHPHPTSNQRLTPREGSPGNGVGGLPA